jgi:hypothetical protein
VVLERREVQSLPPFRLKALPMHVPGRFINDAHHRIDRAGATPLNPGSIFFDEDFKFHDGQAGEKLFLVLGTLGAVSFASSQ